jgi:NitT/TauT family transport system permease protein
MVGRARTVVAAMVAFVLLVVLWELAKLVLPDDCVLLGDTRILPRTDDSAMPHVWTVLGRLFEPEVAGAATARTVGAAVASGALFTLGLALVGLVLGGVLGMLLALAMQRFGLLERAMLPYVVASQTVPLIAIAPLVAGWGGKIAIRSGSARIADIPPWDDAPPLETDLAAFPGTQILIVLPAKSEQKS